MVLKEKFLDLEGLLIEIWGEYQKLHHELDIYRGKELTDEQMSKVNSIIREIQEKFHEMYPIFVFIKERGAFAIQAVHDYNKFIEDIKKAGATEEVEAKA